MWTSARTEQMYNNPAGSLLDPCGAGGWQLLNCPPGSSISTAAGRGECPHSELLIAGAGLVGATKDDVLCCGRYCGCWQVRVDDLGILSGRRGTEFHPDTFCKRLFCVLKLTIELAEYALQHPLEIQNGTVHLTLPIEKLRSALGVVERSYQGNVILKLLSEHTPPIAGQPPRQRTPKERIRYVGSMLRQVRSRIFTGDNNQDTPDPADALLSEKIPGCSLAPRSGFSGMVS